MEPADRATDLLDVPSLLERSMPAARVNWTAYALGGFLLAMLVATVAAPKAADPSWPNLVPVAAFGMSALLVALTLLSFYKVRRIRAELATVERIGEMLQLRRWSEAAIALAQYLSFPVRAAPLRTQALVYLTAVLARLGRFADVIAVQDHLLAEGMLDAGSTAALKVSRAMAMLREDHLFDADRAINELRRGPAGGGAPLALVEMYRDVKTGHPAEAVEVFERRLPELRDQLGHRLADAYVLAARAYDLQGRGADAQLAFGRATLLAPAPELFRRYPEAQPLAGRYAVAPAPPEAA